MPQSSDAGFQPVAELFLDPQNPRLVEHSGFRLEDQDEIIRALWRERAVDEVAISIAETGYWPHEVLFAEPEAGSGRLVVIEGNRRLAAVKLLLDENLRERVGASGLPTLTDAQKRALNEVPVVLTSRREQWQYLGFKHLNGPQDWDSIAKAEYIARVHNEFGIPLDNIARTIGDKHSTVERLYRGLMALAQAERTGRFNREDRFNKRLAFSHLWTGLGYAGIQRFLGIKSSDGFKSNPVPDTHEQNLVDLCIWLYGSKRQGIRPLVKSQNPDLRNLDEVLQDEDGVAALRREYPIQTALNISRGADRLFREAIIAAEQALREALGMVVTGYDGDVGIATRVKDIYVLAERIKQDVDSIRSKPSLPAKV